MKARIRLIGCRVALLIVLAALVSLFWFGSEDLSLKTEVDGIWRDADIGTDDAYSSLLKHGSAKWAVAPGDLRGVVASWPKPISFRNWPQDMSFACREGHLYLSWSGKITSGLDESDAKKRFDTVMQDQGYRIVAEKKESNELAGKIGFSPDDIERWAGTKDYPLFVRRVGDTEIVAIADMSCPLGSRKYRSSVRYQWAATRPYSHRQPTLTEALAVLPSWFRAYYLSEAFYKTMGDDAILVCDTGNGTSIEFDGNVYDKLVKVLEADGFEYSEEHEARPDKRVQRSWQRYSDATYAHITTYPDGSRTRFRCQAPQHKGSPREGKRLPRHPMLGVPRSKRLIIEFEQLPFRDPTFENKTRLFHDMAEKLADVDWFVQRYKDSRSSNAPGYVGKWQTADIRRDQYGKDVRPYRGVGISLRGTHDKPYSVTGEEWLNRADISGEWVPRQGWAARVRCSLRADQESGLFDSYCSANVIFVPNTERWFRFSNPLNLTGRTVGANFRESDDFSYSYIVRTPLDNHSRNAEKLAESRRRFLALYVSPESLRDVVLAEIAELRQIAKDQIPRLENVTAIDYRDVHIPRSSIPGPHERPTERPATVGDGEPSEATKRELLDQVMKQLDDREKLIRENYRQMYEAINKALPLNEILPALTSLGDR